MTSTLTVGVAIAIPQPHATVLTNWRRQVGDPAAELVFPHVTLLPPTPIPAEQIDVVEAHLATAADGQSAFTMHLSGTGTFRPTSAVVFVQIAAGLANCELIETAVRRGPLARELDFPYHPHVTVAQDLDDAPLDVAYAGLAGFVARFHVDRLVLFCRDGSGQWTWRREFPLGGGSAVTSG